MRRRRLKLAADDGDALLRQLVELSPAPAEQVLRPVALRSVALQRRQALAPYQAPTWLDRVLLHAEWLVAVILVLLIGYQLINGPVYDRLHAPAASTSVTRAVPRTQAVAAVVPSRPVRPSAAATGGPHPELGLAL